MSNDMDLSNWMANLPTAVRSRPIHTISMPGSHDSFSYAISWRSKIGPDEPSIQFFNRIPFVGRIVKRLIYRWWVTQETTLTEQLQLGIRYFDLRLAPNPDTNTVHLVHGLYAMSVAAALDEISSFLRTHSKEIVLLDFQHLHQFTAEHHKFVADKTRQVFGSKLCPFEAGPGLPTLDRLWRHNHQVFVFYRSDGRPDDFWPAESLPNPWANTTDPEALAAFLNENRAKRRCRNGFYVTQGVLTPTKMFCLMHFCSSLKNTLAKAACQVLFAFVRHNQTGLNVVMFDFVGSSIDLIKYVILLNFNTGNKSS